MSGHLRMLLERHGKSFEIALRQTKETQEYVLQNTLHVLSQTEYGKNLGIYRGMSLSEFQNKVPVVCWEDIASLTEQQKLSGKPVVAKNVVRWMPTSGSTGCRKWIPWTESFLNDLNNCLAVWYYSLDTMHKGLLPGRHYWSLSWLPDQLRGTATNNDGEFLTGELRKHLEQVFLCCPDIARLPTNDAAMFASAALLASCPVLTMISVWSPTFLLELVNILDERRDDIFRVLRDGEWPSEEFSGLPAPERQLDGFKTDINMTQLVRKLWPSLRVISSWGDAHAQPSFRVLRSKFPHVFCEPKGLWSTEGVVTVPWFGYYPLAIHCHFYEFLDFKTQKMVCAHELQEGQLAYPVLTTRAGLIRYRMNDLIKVDAMVSECPSVRFLGRSSTIDLTGEKMTFDFASAVLKDLESHWEGLERQGPSPHISLLAEADPDQKPGYLLVTSALNRDCVWVAQETEKLLCESHHYRLARELGQLRRAGVLRVRSAESYFRSLARLNGQVAGAAKTEPLALCRADSGLIGERVEG